MECVEGYFSSRGGDTSYKEWKGDVCRTRCVSCFFNKALMEAEDGDDDDEAADIVGSRRSQVMWLVTESVE
jgi:hypothetical protein